MKRTGLKQCVFLQWIACFAASYSVALLNECSNYVCVSLLIVCGLLSGLLLKITGRICSPRAGVWAPLALMAVAVPKLTSGGAVRIRIRCGELGTTKWREGVFEIHERDNKINLLVKFNSGGAPRMFQVQESVFSFNHDIWSEGQEIVIFFI